MQRKSRQEAMDMIKSLLYAPDITTTRGGGQIEINDTATQSQVIIQRATAIRVQNNVGTLR